MRSECQYTVLRIDLTDTTRLTCTTVSPRNTISFRTSDTSRSCSANHFSASPPPAPARTCTFHTVSPSSRSFFLEEEAPEPPALVDALVVSWGMLAIRSYTLAIGEEGFGSTSAASKTSCQGQIRHLKARRNAARLTIPQVDTPQRKVDNGRITFLDKVVTGEPLDE
jgi:hypothetical protein